MDKRATVATIHVRLILFHHCEGVREQVDCFLPLLLIASGSALFEQLVLKAREFSFTHVCTDRRMVTGHGGNNLMRDGGNALL